MLCLHKFRMGFDMDAFWITRLFIRVRHNFQLVWLMSAFSSKWSEIQTPKQPISSTSYWNIFNSKWYAKSSETLLISKLKHQNTVDGINININSSENARFVNVPYTNTTESANDNIMLHQRKNSFNKYAHCTFRSNNKKKTRK